MFDQLKRRLVAWAITMQRKEEARLRRESQRRSDEYEQATGQPFRLTDEELRQLAEKAKGMDAQRVRKVSILHPDDIEKLIAAIESLENR
jgi:hypothetical protein